jgi:steroid delta-isomerase-like uncharacterized protein
MAGMSADDNRNLVRRLLEEVWNSGNLGLVEEILATDFLRHGPPSLEGVARGPEGFKQLVTMYRAAFPNLRISVEDQVAEGDKVVTRWTAHGTHGGELMGLSPTGKEIAVPGIIIDRIREGKIHEEWVDYDGLGMMQTLGALPAVGQARQ